MTVETAVALRPCHKCGRSLPVDDFPPGKRKGGRSDGRTSQCRDCRDAYMQAWRAANREQMLQQAKDRYASLTPEQLQAKRAAARHTYQENSWRWRRDRMLKKYGMTMDQYDEMKRAQGNRCAICGREPSDADKGSLHVDHCHTTGVVRGLLCTSCNNGLGRFRDDVNILARAIAYLTEKP